MEILVYVLSGVVGLVSIASLWLAKSHANDLMRMVAQTDERTKLYQREHSLLVNRFMAVLTPNNYAAMREQSGTIEGAPLSTKPHYIDPAVVAEELDRMRKQADQATVTMNRVRAAQAADAVERNSGPIGSTLGFEQNGASIP